jgi:hypothetical protein
VSLPNATIFVWSAGDTAGNFIAGRVVVFLGVICFCLFCTAETCIRQLIGHPTAAERIVLPAHGYLAAVGTTIYGVSVFAGASSAGLDEQYVAGHIVFAIGLVAGCVATVAAASTKFSLTSKNAHAAEGERRLPADAFPRGGVVVLAAVPIVLALVSWSFAIVNLLLPTTPARFTVGHIVAGLAFVCTSLIGLSSASFTRCRTRTANVTGSSGHGSSSSPQSSTWCGASCFSPCTRIPTT